MRTHAASVQSMPWLLAAARPQLVGLRISRTPGAVSDTTSTVRSADALSTTTMSTPLGTSDSLSVWRQRPIVDAEFQVTTTAATSGASAGRLTPRDCTRLLPAATATRHDP